MGTQSPGSPREDWCAEPALCCTITDTPKGEFPGAEPRERSLGHHHVIRAKDRLSVCPDCDVLAKVVRFERRPEPLIEVGISGTAAFYPAVQIHKVTYT